MLEILLQQFFDLQSKLTKLNQAITILNDLDLDIEFLYVERAKTIQTLKSILPENDNCFSLSQINLNVIVH